MEQMKEMIFFLADVAVRFTNGRCYRDTLKIALEFQTRALMEHLEEDLNRFWEDDDKDHDCHCFVHFEVPNDDKKRMIVAGETLDSFKLRDCCPICLEGFKAGEMGLWLVRCRHLFHLRCINQWLLNNTSCPICRRHV